MSVDLVTSDIIVRDEKGNFIPDLKQDEFEIYEDGVKQDVISMSVIAGGRVTNVLAAPPPPPPEGIILPPSRPKNDVSGRIFLFFVDDLHLQFHNTGRVRQLFQKIAKELVHEGDMFGIVSSGPSSIAVDMTYDKNRLDEAIKKIAGSELSPTDIIQGPSGAEGPSEVRYRAHVAFSTVNDLLNNLESVHNRRKALVYVSDGYDFNPFQDSRLGTMDPNSPFQQNNFAQQQNQANQSADGSSTGSAVDPMTQQQKQNETFADADLARELGELTRQANRSNVTMYTIDPRGLVGMGDIDQNVDPHAVERLRPQVAGQPARPGRGNRRHRRRQPERLQQGAEADRRRDQRLLRAGVLLEEPGRDASAGARSRSRLPGRAPAPGSGRNTCSSPRPHPFRPRRSSRRKGRFLHPCDAPTGQGYRCPCHRRLFRAFDSHLQIAFVEVRADEVDARAGRTPPPCCRGP